MLHGSIKLYIFIQIQPLAIWKKPEKRVLCKHNNSATWYFTNGWARTCSPHYTNRLLVSTPSLSLILIPQLFVVHFFLVAEQVNCWKSGLVPSSNGLALSLEIASFHAQPLNSVFRKMYALQLNFEMYKRAGGKLCFAGRSRSAPALYIIRQQTWT